MVEDAQLLRQFIEGGSEAAFAELVHRHLALVYHAAVRQLGEDGHLAPDVAQSVFILLAEKSRSLLDHPSVAGWLHTTTHFKVSELRRAERRRRYREEAAQAMSTLMNETISNAEWDRMRPVIDEALMELGPDDREAVLLRFFENRPFAEIGERLRLNEKSAHKRVERALDKLRERLARRGVTSTAGALATLLSGQAALAVPVGLSGSVTGAVVASGLPAASLGAISFMSAKTAVAVSVMAVILSGGVAIYEVNTTQTEAAALAVAMHENETWAARLREERTRAANEQASVRAPEVITAPKPPPANGLVGPTMEQRLDEGRAFLKANPAFRAAFAAKQRGDILMQYADHIAALGLTGDRLEQFLTVMMNARMSILGQHVFSLSERPPESGEFTRQLRDVLGETGYQKYTQLSHELDRVGTARSLADDLTRSLYFTSTPLTAPQVEQMNQLMVQVISDPSNGPSYSGPARDIPLPVWDALLIRASGVLAEPQIEALRDLRQQSKFYHVQAQVRKSYDQSVAK